MSNEWSVKYKQNVLEGDQPSLISDTIKAYLIEGYSGSRDEEFLSELAAADGTIVSSFTLTSKTATLNVFDSGDGIFPSVAAGPACDLMVIAEDSGSLATSDIVMWIDTATNLPVTPNGEDIPVAWDNGASKIGAL